MRPPWHRHGERVHDVVETVQARFQHDVPVFVGQGGEGGIARYTRAQDDAVVRAVRFNVGFELRAAGIAVAHVELQDVGSAALRLNVGHDGLGLFAAAAAMDRDVEPVRCQLVGDRAANATACARHKNTAAHVVRLLFGDAWKRVIAQD